MNDTFSSTQPHAWAIWGQIPSSMQSWLVKALDAQQASILLLGTEASALEQEAESWQGQLNAVRWHALHPHNSAQDGAAIAHRVGALRGLVVCADTALHQGLEDVLQTCVQALSEQAAPLPVVFVAGTAVWWQLKDWLQSHSDAWRAQGLRLGAVCTSPMTQEAAWQQAWGDAVALGGAHDVSGMSPLSQCLGMELQQLGDGAATVLLSARDAVRNSFGVVHGGALMSVMDVAMALAARSYDMRQGVVTIEMKSSFMRAADLAHGHLQAHGKVLHRTPTLAFCEVSVLDGKGQCCAHGTGTFKVLARLASGHRKIHDLTSSTD